MSITFVNILAPLLALIMMAKAYSGWRRGERTGRELLIWITIWGGIGAFGLFPKLADFLPPIIGLKSGVNVIIFLSLILVFSLIFKLFTIVESIDQKLTDLTRAIALKEVQTTTNIFRRQIATRVKK